MSKTTIHPDFTSETPKSWSRSVSTGSFNIRIVSCNYYRNVGSWNYPLHSKPFWYLWRSEHPGGHLEFDGGSIALSPDIRVLMPPHTPFCTRSTSNFSQYYVHFSISGKEFGENFEVRRCPIILPAEDSEKFFAGLCDGTIRPEQVTLIAYRQVADALLEIPESFLLPPDEPSMDPRISAALNLLSHAGNTKFTNAEIARKIGMSETNFLRIFRREIRNSPRQYQLRLLLDHCLEQLTSTELSMDDIAAGGGFADRYHFSKAFRKVFGIPPGRFRRDQRKMKNP